MNRPPATAALSRRFNHLLEGGLFYPTGYIVAGLPDEAQAHALCELFRASGYTDEECLVIPAQQMAQACTVNMHAQRFIAAWGSSAHVRERQLQLAREGCHFLMIDAASEAEKRRALRVLARVPVRYATHYHRFVIEDLIELLPSATADCRDARAV
jgi:hypothetical protein